MSKFSTKGVNFMKSLKVESDKIQAREDDKILFELQNKLISNCNVVKSDLVLELNELNGPKDHNLSEVRFYIPQ